MANVAAFCLVVVAILATRVSHPLAALEVVFSTAVYHSRPPIVQPSLEANETIRISLGKMDFGSITSNNVGGRAVAEVGLNGFFPVRPFVHDKHVCVDATIFAAGTMPTGMPVRVACNALVLETLPWRWDYNSDQNAIEIS
jgi:hypothetical protein